MPKPPTTVTTEVVAHRENDKRQRRRFTAEEKLRILSEVDRCSHRGEVGAILRREGIYSSLLSAWRQSFARHGAAGLEPRPAGRKRTRDRRDDQIQKLERQKARLEHELLIARKLLELAGKAHEILGVTLPSLENDELL